MICRCCCSCWESRGGRRCTPCTTRHPTFPCRRTRQRGTLLHCTKICTWHIRPCRGARCRCTGPARCGSCPRRRWPCTGCTAPRRRSPGRCTSPACRIQPGRPSCTRSTGSARCWCTARRCTAPRGTTSRRSATAGPRGSGRCRGSGCSVGERAAKHTLCRRTRRTVACPCRCR